MISTGGTSAHACCRRWCGDKQKHRFIASKTSRICAVGGRLLHQARRASDKRATDMICIVLQFYRARLDVGTYTRRCTCIIARGFGPPPILSLVIMSLYYISAPPSRLRRPVTPRACPARLSLPRRSLRCDRGPLNPNFRSALVLRPATQTCTIGSDL